MDQGNEVRHPDARAQPLAGDVTDHQAQGGAKFENLEEITGKMADGKNLSRDLELLRMELARRAEPALNLGRLEKAALDHRVLTAQRAQFVLERTDFFAVFPRARKLPGVLIGADEHIVRFRSGHYSWHLTEPHLVHFWTFLRPLQKSADELVADAVHREEITRILGNGFEFLPDAHDVRVDRAGSRIVFIAPDFVEQTVAAQRLPGVAQEKLQEVELLAREFDRFTSTADLVAAEVDFDVAESVAVLILRESLRAAQHRFDAGQQLANGKRLGDVVVGAKLESHDLVHFLAAGGQHDDGDRRALGFQLLAYVEAAHPGHHDVQNDQIRRNLQGLFESLDAVEGGRDLKAFELKIVA